MFQPRQELELYPIVHLPALLLCLQCSESSCKTMKRTQNEGNTGFVLLTLVNNHLNQSKLIGRKAGHQHFFEASTFVNSANANGGCFDILKSTEKQPVTLCRCTS